MKKISLILSFLTLCMVGVAGNHGGASTPPAAVTHGCPGPGAGHHGPHHSCSSTSQASNRNTECNNILNFPHPIDGYLTWNFPKQILSPANDPRLKIVYANICNAEKMLADSDTVAAVDKFVNAYDSFNNLEPAVKARNYDLKRFLIKRMLSLQTASNGVKQGNFFALVIREDLLHYENVMQDTYGSVAKAEKSFSNSKSDKAASAFSNAYEKLNEAIDFNNEILSCGERLDKLNIYGDVKELINECTAKSEMLLSLKKYLDTRISTLPKSVKDS